jgi:large exoprotein involved in heme utilization and adhesion
VTIDTQGLFQSPDSAIAASSQFGLDGTVQIDTSATVNLNNSSLATLPLDPEVYPACHRNNSFVVAGTGGFSPQVDDPLDSISGWQDNSPLPTTSTETPAPTTPPPNQIIEAQGWRRNPNGTVDFVVNPPRSQVADTSAAIPNCDYSSAQKQERE